MLRLTGNKLAALPPDIGRLTQLRVLAADSNALTAVPPELRNCTRLRELLLDNNKLVRPLLDARSYPGLTTLGLGGNSLEFLPELLPCSHLRCLSLANIKARKLGGLGPLAWAVGTFFSCLQGMGRRPPPPPFKSICLMAGPVTPLLPPFPPRLPR